MKPNRDPRLQTLIATPANVLFLDVETTGLSHYYDQITLLGWSVGQSYEAALPWDPMDSFKKALESASALVTFNGTLFDLRFLRREFPDLRFPSVHVDLRYLAKRAKLTGGQKNIERSLGINLREGLEEVDGRMAVVLWHRYLRGDVAALRQLIAYNRADVLAMRSITDHLIQRLEVQSDLFARAPKFGSKRSRSVGHAHHKAVLPQPRARGEIRSYQASFINTPGLIARSVGIDLTGSDKRPSGWCLLDGSAATTRSLRTDDELIEETIAARPQIVSIDSPLSLPFGRIDVSDTDPGREKFGIMRQCERELKRRGINVYPCLLPSMQALTKRGIALASRFRKLGLPVIECYPGAAQDIIGIPRKGAGTDLLILGMSEFGIRGDFANKAVTHDELDAVTCALVGHFFLSGKYEELSGEQEGSLIIPKLTAAHHRHVIGISGRISAGKTTASRFFERKGFAYSRFSLIIDEELELRKLPLNRANRQLLGREIHEGKGQRWLAERTLARVHEHAAVVIDGLRFPEDHATLAELCGSGFVHLHISAAPETRRHRYQMTGDHSATFEEADGNPVEVAVDQLATLASVRIENSGTLDDLYSRLAPLCAEEHLER